MANLAQLQDELRTHESMLQEIEEILAAAPDYQDALDMKTETLAKKKETEGKIAALKGSGDSVESTTIEVASKDDSSTFRKDRTKPSAPAAQSQTFKVNDNVSAKYHLDKTFYPATIISVTGSSAAPIYTVKFKGYTGTETVRGHEIRPLLSSTAASSTKRKADGSLVESSSSTPAPPAVAADAASSSFSKPAATISAAPNIDQERKEALDRETAQAPKGLPQPERMNKKIRSDGQLKKAQNSWQDFQKKGATGKAAKLVKKESMFRTGESATARVGFTGSGQAMRKDVGRERFKYSDQGSGED